ncbi:MAG: hypothetical protein IT547_16920 [Hyphomonadaceae bacterium]|jgi:hypothetical protein|nr:hypothetical protein [Hyphomonadaceae bacterium]
MPLSYERDGAWLKRCLECGQEKAADLYSFHANLASSDGLASRCKVCANFSRQAGRYALPKGAVKQAVTESQGQCEICGDVGKLNVDHSHDTGDVRGLVCTSCNIGLSFFRDNAAALRRAAEYLEAPTRPQWFKQPSIQTANSRKRGGARAGAGRKRKSEERERLASFKRPNASV